MVPNETPRSCGDLIDDPYAAYGFCNSYDIGVSSEFRTLFIL